MQGDASAFSDYITVQENARELAFAVAAGDVPLETSSHGDHEGYLEEASHHGTLQLHEQESRDALDGECLPAALTMAAEEPLASSSGLTTTLSDVNVESANNGMEGPEGEASATASMAEGQS